MKKSIQAVPEKLLSQLSSAADTTDSQTEFGDVRGDDEALVADAMDVNAEMREVAAARVTQALAAIAAVQRGEYGICVGCRKKISNARLEAVPEATRCVSCQRDEERANA